MMFEVLRLRLRISAGGSDAAKTPQVRFRPAPPSPHARKIRAGNHDSGAGFLKLFLHSRF
jgi:hypothetical protein